MSIEDNERLVDSSESGQDNVLDTTLRPQNLDEFVGQQQIKDNLDIYMEAARRRNEPIEHVLLYGPPGLGKTTLAHIIAREMGANLKVTTGPAIEKTGDLAALLTNLEPGDILFIDEIHRLNKIIEEVLYPAMEDYVLDIIIGKGPSAKTLRIDLPKFTLIGATTKISSLTSPLRDRFGNTYRLDFYNHEDIDQIINRSAGILGVNFTEPCSLDIARRARKTPRIANRLLKRVRDYAEVKNNGQITSNMVRGTLDLLGVDELGLDQVDRRILQTVIEKFGGGPVGLNTLSAATSEEMDAIEDVYEPFLLQLGFINRTNRGRIITDEAYKHLGFKKDETA
jgi:holliday junction DNA helicase RuvB